MILTRKTANPGKHLEISGCQSDRKAMHTKHPAMDRAAPHGEGLSC